MPKDTQKAGFKLPVEKQKRRKGSVLVFDETRSRDELIKANAAHRAKLDAEHVQARAKRSETLRKKAAESAAQGDELRVHTMELKPVPSEGPERDIKTRSKCLKVGKSLITRGETGSFPMLKKAGKKICNCRVVGLWQELTPSVNYNVGAFLCKQRFCPNCQRVVSAKRKENTRKWFLLNAEALRSYKFYHVVLTVPHSKREGLRDGLYVTELLDGFARLRGTAKGMGTKVRKRVTAWWSSWIAGGFYYVENKPGKDGSPHIHLHCIMLAKKALWNAKEDSVFVKQCGARWALLTGNQKQFQGVFVDPVYYIDEETGKRVNCHQGKDLHIERALSEAVKYTMKTDVETLESFDDAFLSDMLTAKNRYYGRFGCLNAKSPDSKKFKQLDMLCTDYKDLAQVTALEAARLFNPETGEIVDKSSTRYVVTPFRNMRATQKVGWVEGEDGERRPLTDAMLGGASVQAAGLIEGVDKIAGETVYQFDKQVDFVLYYHPDDLKGAAGRMGAGAANNYRPELDYPEVGEAPAAPVDVTTLPVGSVSYGPRTAEYMRADMVKAAARKRKSNNPHSHL